MRAEGVVTPPTAYARTPDGDLVPVEVLQFFTWARAEVQRLIDQDDAQQRALITRGAA